MPAILGSRNEVERINRYHTEYLNGEDQPFSSPLFSTRNLFRADYPASRTEPFQEQRKPMSITHPIIAVTGSSGAGTTSVTRSFQHIFRRDKINAEKSSRATASTATTAREMKAKMLERMAAGDNHFSHFGPEANLLGDLENLFREYGETGAASAATTSTTPTKPKFMAPNRANLPPGKICRRTPTSFLRRAARRGKTADIDVSRHVDLCVGVVPIINLEWIQKIHRDKSQRGYSKEAVMDTILRRMPDYINYICPQFSRTHVNFQRVPTVDTSNPLIANDIPSLDESFVVIRFANPKGIDFPICSR